MTKFRAKHLVGTRPLRFFAVGLGEVEALGQAVAEVSVELRSIAGEHDTSALLRGRPLWILPVIVDRLAILDQAGPLDRQPDHRIPEFLEFLDVVIGAARRVAVEEHEDVVVTMRGRLHALPDSEVKDLAVNARAVLGKDSHALTEELVFLIGVADVGEAEVDSKEKVAGTDLGGGVEDGVDFGDDFGVVVVGVGIKHGRTSRAWGF